MNGMLLWNITSALCVAPLVHSKMTLEDRAECAISGFVLQDLWSMIATQREKSFRCPKGKMQMAGQTKSNMQQIALTTLAILTCRSPFWYPWNSSHSLSEIRIEHHFGRLRSQFASGTMTTRDFFNAAARLMRMLPNKCQKPSSSDVLKNMKILEATKLLVTTFWSEPCLWNVCLDILCFTNNFCVEINIPYRLREHFCKSWWGCSSSASAEMQLWNVFRCFFELGWFLGTEVLHFIVIL